MAEGEKQRDQEKDIKDKLASYFGAKKPEEDESARVPELPTEDTQRERDASEEGREQASQGDVSPEGPSQEEAGCAGVEKQWNRLVEKTEEGENSPVKEETQSQELSEGASSADEAVQELTAASAETSEDQSDNQVESQIEAQETDDIEEFPQQDTGGMVDSEDDSIDSVETSEEERATPPDSSDISGKGEKVFQDTGARFTPESLPETGAEELDMAVSSEAEAELTEETGEGRLGGSEEVSDEDEDDGQVDKAEASAKKQGFNLESLQKRLKNFFSSSNGLIGIDIGFSSIKIIQLNYAGKNVYLAGFGYKVIPFDIRSKEKARNEFVMAVLKELMRENNMNALNAVTVVSGPGVSINSLTVPQMAQKEVKGAVALELKKSLPFDLEEAIFDFQVGGEVHDRVGVKLEVIAVAAQKSLVNKKTELITQVGLKPIRVSLVPFTLLNIVQKGMILAEGEVIAIVDLGARSTTISFFKEGRLQFSREISTAGDHITQSMIRTITTESGRVTITIDEAERLKSTWGIPTKKDATNPDAKKEIVSIAQIAAMMRPVLERLMTEMKRSINYYRQAFKVNKIDRLFLTGGTSRLRNLDEYFSRNLVDVKIEKLDPLEVIAGWTDPRKSNQELLEKLVPNLATCFGIALEKKPAVNLIPLEAKIQQKLELVKFALKITIPVLALLLSIFYATFYSQVTKYRKLVDSAHFAIAKLQPTIERIKEYDRMRQAIEERKALLEKAVGRQPVWSGALKELSLITPEGIILTRLSTVPETQPVKIRIEGDIYPTYTSIDLTLSQYMITLDESPFFVQVELVATTRDPYSPTPKASFELVCQLVY